MREGLRRAGSLAAAVGLAAALAGCGGENSPRPPVVVITPEPVRGVIAQVPVPNFLPDNWISLPVVLSQQGVLDITVDWTFPDTWMYVYLGRTNCDYAQLSSHTCPFFLSSETKDPKPRVLVTEELQPSTYYLVLYNVPLDPKAGTGSNNTESAMIQLGLTIRASGDGSSDAIHLGRPIVVSPPRL
jgi:hypothetical protein